MRRILIVVVLLCVAIVSTAVSEDLEEIEVFAEPGTVYEEIEENDEYLEEILSTAVYSTDSDDLAESYINLRFDEK